MLEEMKEQSRLPVCPHRVGHYPFCMTNRRKTIPEQRRALDNDWRNAGQSRGVWRGRVGWLCTRWHKRYTSSSSWKSLSFGVWSAGFGSSLLQSFKSGLGPRLERLARAGPPAAAPTSGYTSVEKYSVFRFSSAKEMGGCCR